MSEQDPVITPELIVRAYASGVFPMAMDAGSAELYWSRPEMRGIFPLDGFQVSKRLARTLRTHRFTIRVDTDFDAVIEGCATAGSDRASTWINDSIRQLYGELFDRGVCHTVEVWDGEDLTGGVYGLSLGAAFFGESMFHRASNASKIALAHLVERLNAGGYRLFDTQYLTPHLQSLGAVEISRRTYEARLAEALGYRGDFYALDAQT